MARRGNAAKVLGDGDVRRLLRLGRQLHPPARSQVMILLTIKAGLRACEVSGLTWAMVTDGNGRIGHMIELPSSISKKSSGRRVPLHPELRRALVELEPSRLRRTGPVIRSSRGGSMCAKAIVNWFTQLYSQAKLDGCSSHSGRRTFVTKAARNVHRAGGSLRDVQELAGHRSIQTTQSYIEGDSDAQRRLVRLI